MLPNSNTLRYGDIIKDLLSTVESVDKVKLERVQETFNEMWKREDKYRAWIRTQDNKIGEGYLDSPFFTVFNQEMATLTPSVFVPIPPNANHLYIMGSIRTDRASFNDRLIGHFNGDTGANYIESYYGQADGAGITGETYGQSYFGVSETTGASATSGATGSFFLYLAHIRSPFWKNTLKINGTPEYASAAVSLGLTTSAHWKSTDPIVSITFSSLNGANIVTGSRITVYGMK